MAYDNHNYILAMFNETLLRYTRELEEVIGVASRAACLANIAHHKQQFSEWLGPDKQPAITIDEALEMTEYCDIDFHDLTACMDQANSLIGEPAMHKSYSYYFSGRFVDIREMFSSYVDQTCNDARIDGLQGADDHHNAYGTD
jgi:hypothetical protein